MHFEALGSFVTPPSVKAAKRHRLRGGSNRLGLRSRAARACLGFGLFDASLGSARLAGAARRLCRLRFIVIRDDGHDGFSRLSRVCAFG